MSYCTKRGYKGATAAQEALQRLVQRWLDGTLQDLCVAQRAYLCPDCGDYHLTKTPPRRFNPSDVHVVLPPKAKALLAQRLATSPRRPDLTLSHPPARVTPVSFTSPERNQ